MNKNLKQRMIESTLWGIWWLLFVSASVWALVGSGGYWVRTGWIPAEAAVWAQALGSLLAVAVAVAIPAFQVRRQARDRAMERVQQRCADIEAVRALIVYLMKLTKRLESYNQRPAVYTASNQSALSHELRQCGPMVREIPITAFSNELVHIVLGLRAVGVNSEFAADVIERSGFAMNADLTTVKKEAKANIELMSKWQTQLDDLEAGL